ncbi:hypothetical protein [Tranquillimonas alkanivorans]|uniref:Uncharacterized protein n=1 Tax=Tranquillimonas alkanivorans TaxID=441119 RepID=A0A1I5W2U6_9RHOB|nr:hypothetical protein [Tranquillimonas alkanivorans]SFQ14094.1 hypothetical protein SAMN04488047_13920 [Tranquillimonas alkanivorans]
MGFIFGCLLIWIIAHTIVTAYRDKGERKKLFDEMRQEPLETIFLTTYSSAFVIFFIGIFIPALGEVEVGDTGWRLWQVAGVVSFGRVAVQLFCGWPKLK